MLKFIIILNFTILLTTAVVPHDIRERLRKVHNLRDLLADFHVMYDPVHTNSHVEKNLPPTAVPIQIRHGSMGAKTFVSSIERETNQHIDSYTFDHLSGMHSITQGNDTCNLQSVCTPVPQQSDDPRIIVFPKCYEVMQCVGSCCDELKRCKPTSLVSKKVTVVLFSYAGNNRLILNSTKEITMEEHNSCSCYDCGMNRPKCSPGFIVGESCKCECANKKDRDNCAGKSTWDDKTCKCECDLSCNTETHVPDIQQCRCVKKRNSLFHRHNHRHHKHGNTRNTGSRAIPIAQEEIDNVPKLKLGKIGN